MIRRGAWPRTRTPGNLSVTLAVVPAAFAALRAAEARSIGWCSVDLVRARPTGPRSARPEDKPCAGLARPCGGWPPTEIFPSLCGAGR